MSSSAHLCVPLFPLPQRQKDWGSCSSDHQRHWEGGGGGGHHRVPLLRPPPRATVPGSGFPASPRGLHPSVKLNRRPPTPHSHEAGPRSRLRARGPAGRTAVLRAPSAQHCPLQAPLQPSPRLLASGPAVPLPRDPRPHLLHLGNPMHLAKPHWEVPSLQSPPTLPQPPPKPPDTWESLLPISSTAECQTGRRLPGPGQRGGQR